MRRTILIWIFLLCAVAFRVVLPDQAEERPILPDEVEYTVSAVNLIRGEGYHIVINGTPYPPRYAFGYPLCLAPFYFLLGEELGNGIFCTLVFSLATLLLLFIFVRKLFEERIAFWSVLFLSLSPLHIHWGRSIMGDVPFSFLMLLAVWVLFLGKGNFARLFWVGTLIGIGAWLKYLSLLFFPICVLFLCFQKMEMRKKCYCVGSLCLGLVFSLIPLLLYNRWNFGSPFQTGFNFWEPEWYRCGHTFSLSYGFYGPPLPAGKALPGLLVFGRLLLGFSNLWEQNPYPFFLTPLIGVGVWKILLDGSPKGQRKNEFLFFTFLAVGLFYGVLSFYFAQNLRYLMPVVPLLLILAAVGFDHFLNQWPNHLQNGLVFLLGGALLAVVTVSLEADKGPPLRKTYVHLIQNRTEENAHIITEWDPVSFYHKIQRGSKRAYLPISEELEYVHEPFAPDPRREIPFLIASRDLESIEKMVMSKKSVYIDSLSCNNYQKECGILKEKFHFKEVASLGEVQLYRLVGS